MAKPSDIESLISALEYLVKHPDKRSEIGRNGYNKCKLYNSTSVPLGIDFTEQYSALFFKL